MRKIIALTVALLLLTLIGCSRHPKVGDVVENRFDEMIDRLAEENIGRIIDIYEVDYLCFITEVGEVYEESCRFIVKFESSNFGGDRYADVIMAAAHGETGYYEVELSFSSEVYNNNLNALHSEETLNNYEQALEEAVEISWYAIDVGTIRARRINQTVERLQ